ncbi:hypothetical protein FRB93_013978 [Tulasnella sp. JGI-2019a]|nr:hypothetical protein FRB93_013978 [Tulasnella sp. JGI-2019a]
MLHPPSMATQPYSMSRHSNKRKHPHSPDGSSSALDCLLKRQRLERDRDDIPDMSHEPSPYPPPPVSLSRSSLSDPDYSDEDEAGPSTPAACMDDNLMDWTADSDLLQPNQLSTSAPTQGTQGVVTALGRDSSPSTDAIHHLQLLREARPPSISTYDATTAAFPARGKIMPMTLETRSDSYIFVVELPGYAPEAITVSCKKGNVLSVVADIWHRPQCLQHWDIAFDTDVHTADIRASMKMNQSTNVLTITARRYRQCVPIEYQVQWKPPSMSTAPPTTAPGHDRREVRAL